MNIKILYLSCHQTLEHADLTILSKLGFNVFPLGFYTYPHNDLTRDSIDFKPDPSLVEQFGHFIPKEKFKAGMPLRLPPAFVNQFDLIINCHFLENFEYNLNAFKNKPVIWRTIGLGGHALEPRMITYKQQADIRIVRMTETEPHTAGCDAVIRTQVDPDYYSGWIGDEPYVLTIQKWTRLGEKGRLADEWDRITRTFERKICGKDIRGFGACMVENPSSAELMDYRRHARVYFSLATHGAAATYTFVEAMMTGMPVISVGRGLAQTPWFENYKFIEHGVSGFVSDNTEELKGYIKLLLNDYDLAKKLGKNARETVLKVFHPDIILESWRKFFKEQYNIETK